MPIDIAENVGEKIVKASTSRFNDEELHTLRESKAVEAIRQKEYATNHRSLGWLALALVGAIPANIQQIREAKSVKNYFFGEAKTVKEFFTWKNFKIGDFSHLTKGKWNIAGSIAMAVGGVMYFITRSRAEAFGEATTEIAKNTLLINVDTYEKITTHEPESATEQGTKWQAREQAKEEPSATTEIKR